MTEKQVARDYREWYGNDRSMSRGSKNLSKQKVIIRMADPKQLREKVKEMKKDLVYN